MLSALVRPNVGEPQMRMSSLVCSGPLIVSAVTNWISEQPTPFVEVLPHVPATCCCQALSGETG